LQGIVAFLAHFVKTGADFRDENSGLEANSLNDGTGNYSCPNKEFFLSDQGSRYVRPVAKKPSVFEASRKDKNYRSDKLISASESDLGGRVAGTGTLE
jgi:hypothetical protein